MQSNKVASIRCWCVGCGRRRRRYSRSCVAEDRGTIGWGIIRAAVALRGAYTAYTFCFD